MAKKKRADMDDTGPPADAPPPGPVLYGPPPEDEVVGPPSPEPPPAAAPPHEPTFAPAPAPAPVAPTGIVAAADIDDRVRRLESTLEQLQELEKRLAARLAEPAPMKSDGPSLLAGAASLLEAGRSLLPAGLAPPPGPPKPGSLADALAEARAAYRMFVDPRYAMSWWGRFGIPALVALFVLPSWWMPLNAVLPEPFRGLLLCVGQLVVGYALFKLVFREARRYREAAPDLPQSLRLP